MIRMKKFKKIYVEITNVCNLNCNFCPKTSRAPKFLSIEEFEHIIKEVSPFTNYIYLHLMGEPLLHEHLQVFIEIADKYHMKVNLTTNGSLLTEDMDFLIGLQGLRQMNVSLHSFEANQQERTLENYVLSVMRFIKKASSQSDLLCSIRLWNMDSEETKGLNTLNQKILDLIEGELEIQGSLLGIIREQSGCKVGKNIYVNMAQKFEWPDINIAEEKRPVFCHGLRDHIGILVDGTVVPCCLDSEGTIALGNVFQQPLSHILATKRAESLYDGFSNRLAVEELCKRCGYATRFRME